jgi:hypothetical protein
MNHEPFEGFRVRGERLGSHPLELGVWVGLPFSRMFLLVFLCRSLWIPVPNRGADGPLSVGGQTTSPRSEEFGLSFA